MSSALKMPVKRRGTPAWVGQEDSKKCPLTDREQPGSARAIVRLSQTRVIH